MEFRWISGSGGLGGSYWVRSQKMPSSRKCSHRNSVQNGPIDSFTALMGTIFVAISVFMSRAPKVDPDPKKTSSPQSCSRRNSVQNAPINSFTALTGTIFVAISVFMSLGHFPATFGQLLDNFGQMGGQVTLRSGLEAQGSGRYAIRSFMLPDQTLRPSA